jgi:tetratricopeptide (TPR) repeat protein
MPRKARKKIKPICSLSPDKNSPSGRNQSLPIDSKASLLTQMDSILAAREGWVVACIFFVAIALRIWNFLEIRAHDPFFYLPSVDSDFFYKWALTIAKGQGDSVGVFLMSPLYPYFLGALFWLFGPGFVLPRIIAAVLGALNCVLIFYIGKRAFNSRIGAMAGLIQALNAAFIFFEGEFLIATIQTPVNLMLVLVLIYSQDLFTLRRAFLAGALLGLSALARPNVLLLGGFVAAYLLFYLRNQMRLTQRLLTILVFAVAAAAVVAPATIRNYVVGHDTVLVSSSAGMNFFIGNGPDASGIFNIPAFFPINAANDPVGQQKSFTTYAETKEGRSLLPSEVSDFWIGRTRDYILDNPGRWVHLLGDKVLLFFNHLEIYDNRDFYSSKAFSTVLRLPLFAFSFVGTFAVLGMVLAAARFRKAYFLYALVATYLVTSMLFFVVARYRLSAVAVMSVFASFGLSRTLETLRNRRLKPLLTGMAILAAAALFVNREPPTRPDDAFIHWNLAGRYRLLKQYDLAILEYRKCIDLNPGYIFVYNNLALTYEVVKNKSDAMKCWTAVRKMAEQSNDQNFLARANLHLELLEKGLFPPP